MTYSALGNFICFILFIIYMLLPANVAAETENLSHFFTEQKIIDENLDIDDSDESEEDIVEDESEEVLVEDELLKIEPKRPFFSFLDTPHDVISAGVEAFARNIDEFFSDDKVFYEASGTYLQLRADTIFNENGDREYDGKIRLKLRLPHTKRKLKFTLESDANERPDDTTAQLKNTPIAAAEEKDYFAGLQATLGKKNEWQFKPSIGLRLSSSVEPYVKFRLKRKYEFTKWNIHWHETPYWFDSFGWGFDSYLELNTKISDAALFRASTFARWTNEADQFELSQVFSMFHTLTKRRALSYFVGVYGNSEPTVFATHYLLGAAYRQNVHKDYLFFEIIPQIKYDKLNDFHAEQTLTLRVEFVFKK